ncbi:MAG: thioredoxin [Gammaproteobacteria bacterium]|nr:thioredoxin [Gammaproteobacteria bacterium]
MNHITEITDGSFEKDVVQSSLPVLVDFWAQWCGPCKAIAPVLEDIAKQFEGRLRVTKLDVDHNPETPPRFGVRGIPTLILFQDGKVAATQVGLLSRTELVSFIENHIGE